MKKQNLLWLFLFLIIFINGFEAGGYQASLYSIGQAYDLSVTKMGIFASVELFATMLAPIILGSWADRTNKIKCILILMGLQATAALFIFCSSLQPIFIGGIFFLGLTTSALQFISIAALAESYPKTGRLKIGIMTSMYALGAFVAPLVVDYYLSRGGGWQLLFIVLFIGTVVAFLGVMFYGRMRTEEEEEIKEETKAEGKFIIAGVLFLCVVMCIYVGFENGFAFFIDTLFTDVLNSDFGKKALSIFWVVMIPSRVLVGVFSKYVRKLLLIAVVAIPCITAIISRMNSPWAVLILCIPLGFACGAIYPCVLNVMLDYSANRKATATAMITTATGIGGVIFTALTGILGERLGLRNAILCLAEFFIASVICVLALQKVKTNE
ncbi:MFS transporter [Butyrivibrio sp. MC2021]|uniref:MFS transporter n=1 Tax=Butyrivibrio sp. MC2021 TaxID=1408306 RepID=UPI000479087F|nr:MFS transporter [Butyrivibrio sp. MC2021]